MVRLILSFDSEDYATPEAADGEKFWAEELSARGLRGSFQCVAEMIRSLQRRHREDVIEALARHEIGCHTDLHGGLSPAPVALEGKGLAEGIEWVLRREARGWALLTETFGRVPISYCPPGDSWTPHVLLAFATAGAKVCVAFCGSPEQSPFWYCGLLCTGYDLGFESFMGDDAAEEVRYKQEFEAILARKPENGVMVLCTHPCRLVTTRFWDFPFYRGAIPQSVPPAPLRPASQINVLKDRFRRLLDWIRERRDVQFVDQSTIYSQQSGHRLDLQSLLDEHHLRPGEADKLPLQEPDAGNPCLQVLKDFHYGWSLYPEGFTGEKTLALARRLAWTYAK